MPLDPLTEALSLIPIGVVAVGLFGISVELYFHTNSFVEEYSEKITALVIQANGEISARIEQLTQVSTAVSKQSKPGTIFPVPAADITEQLLSEIRRIGAEADEWQNCLARGKSYLRRSATWLAVDATVIVALVFILALSIPINPFLVIEYAGGIPTILLFYSLFQFRSIETKLDKARVG